MQMWINKVLQYKWYANDSIIECLIDNKTAS